MEWGLLGSEALTEGRRTRTLGLGSVVRKFNDLAVPGLGGVWFGKQLFLSALGIHVAEKAQNVGKRVQNIEVTNAVEALACWLGLESIGWKRDPRLRGATKMREQSDLSFANVRKRSFYVTQPMRQATIQPLRALGLVESNGERFNAFRCTERGREFIEASSDGTKPYHRSLLTHLVMWVRGEHENVKSSTELERALSPLVPLPPNARNILRERLVQGSGTEAARRHRMLDWMEELRKNTQEQISWDAKPAMLDDDHWRDLQVGSLFFAARDAAIALLDQIEAHLANVDNRRLSLDRALPEAIEYKIASLRERAQSFLDKEYDPSPERAAEHFCRECTEQENKRLLEKLIARDGRGLRQRDRDILPGAAFRGFQVEEPETARSEEEDGAETVVRQSIPLPEGISHRVRNLFFFNLDLFGELNDWLNESVDDAGEEG